MFYGCIYLIAVSDYPKENNIIESKDIYPSNKSRSSLNEEIKSNIIFETDSTDLYEGNIYNNKLIKELDDSPQTNFSISINNDSINSFTTIENILNYFQKSNLKVDKIIKTSHMFSGCISLISLPDL